MVVSWVARVCVVKLVVRSVVWEWALGVMETDEKDAWCAVSWCDVGCGVWSGYVGCWFAG